MNTIIQLTEDDLVELVQQVIRRIKETNNPVQERWVTPKKAQELLNIKTTALYHLRIQGKIAYSQPQKRVILYDRLSIEKYLLNNVKDVF